MALSGEEDKTKNLLKTKNKHEQTIADLEERLRREEKLRQELEKEKRRLEAEIRDLKEQLENARQQVKNQYLSFFIYFCDDVRFLNFNRI